MRVLDTVDQLREARRELDGLSPLGFVPTMGYLHAGHLSLVRARARAPQRPGRQYLRQTRRSSPPAKTSRATHGICPRDLRCWRASGVDIVFTPDAADIYPPGSARMSPPAARGRSGWRRPSRPGHFRGVATCRQALKYRSQAGCGVLRPEGRAAGGRAPPHGGPISTSR